MSGGDAYGVDELIGDSDRWMGCKSYSTEFHRELHLISIIDDETTSDLRSSNFCRPLA